MSTLERDSLAIERVEAIFQRWRVDGAVVWDAPDTDFKTYMDALAAMQSLHDRTAGDTVPPSVKVIHESAKRLLVGETPKLEEGLLHLLLPHSSPVSPERAYEAYKTTAAQVRSSIQEADVPLEERGVCFVPESALWRLHLVVRAMVRRRLVKRCCRIVKQSRRVALMESLRLLARQRFNPKHVPTLTWGELQDRVEQWRQFVKVAVLVLLASERRVCERMFNAAGLSEFCFAEIAMGSEKLLFEFVEAFASSKKSPERLFPLLECYETLTQDLQPTFNEIFAGSGPCKALRNEMTVTMSRVGVAVRGVFSEFEKHIQKEPSQAPANASVHALTNYVVNYLNCLYGYTDILTRLYTTTSSTVIAVPKLMRSGEDDEEGGDEFVEEFVGDEGSVKEEEEFWGEPLPKYQEASSLISRKLQVLEDALRKKAKTHIKEVEKQHFFLMNNLHYMARKVKETDLRRILGDDWIREAADRVQEHANEYMRLTFNRLTSILREETPSKGLHNLLKSAGKDKLVRFCLALDEVYKSQHTWVANPGPLHHELEQAVKRRLVPIYTEYYERNIGAGISMKAPKNIKHPSIVNELINQLFEGPTS